MSARRAERTDLLIQGGGMVGLALAADAARRGLAVTVLDRARPPVWAGGEIRQRVSSLNLASEAYLSAIGAWSRVLAERAAPVRAIEAWDASGGGRVGFDAADLGEPHLAHIVENDLVRSALVDVAEAAGATLLTPAAVASWTSDDEGVTASLDDGRRLDARLLVGADGADSPLRAAAGIEVRESGYGQSGVVCAVGFERPHGGIARQRFLAGGPLALLPLPDGRCSIVWSLPQTEAAAMVGADDEAFTAALETASAGWLGAVTSLGPRAAFTLRRLHARRYVTDRVALVGDAAHVIHPLAGQGANLGLMDALVLGEEIGRARIRGRDPGGRSALRRFERRRRGDNVAMQLAMDGFHQAFTRGEAPLTALRSLGFDLTDRVAPLRRAFMRRAAGVPVRRP